MVFPTFGKGGGSNKDTTFHTLTLVRLKGVGQGGLAMMSDLDMSGNNLANAQSIDTANLTSSNGTINVINADMNIENNELRVKTFKTDKLTSKTAGGAIDIRSKLRLANSDAQTGDLPKNPGSYATGNAEWDNWNDLEARDITCRTLNYTEINPSIAGVIKKVSTVKYPEKKTLSSFYINNTQNYNGNGNLNLTLINFTELAALALTSSKYVFNISAMLNNLPDEHFAYFIVQATHSDGISNITDTYVKSTTDTVITLTGSTESLTGITRIGFYGIYSYSPLIEDTGQTSTLEQYVTTHNVVFTVLECTNITANSTTNSRTLKILIQNLAALDCVFVRLNGNEITQKLIGGSNTADGPEINISTLTPGTIYKVFSLGTTTTPRDWDAVGGAINLGNVTALVQSHFYKITVVANTPWGTYGAANPVVGTIFQSTVNLNITGTGTCDKIESPSLSYEFIAKAPISPATATGNAILKTSGKTKQTSFTISIGSAYSISAFIPHDVNLQVSNANSKFLTGICTDNISNIILNFAQNYVLTVNVTGVVIGETLNLNLDALSNSNTYNETISLTSISLTSSFPQITTIGDYKLSILPDDTGFINYQISASTKADDASVDPESFAIASTFTVNLTVIRLYKISVPVPTLTNGTLKVKLDYTGEVLTFTTGGTQSFTIGVPAGVKINIYSFESPNYQGIKNEYTVSADFTFSTLTLTPLYSVSIIGTNLTNNEVKLTLKTDVGADITENYYNVRCSSNYTSAFAVTTTAVVGIKYNDVNTTILLNGTPTPVPLEGQYTITGTSLVFYYIPAALPATAKVYIISGTSSGVLSNSVKSATRDIYFDLTLTGTVLTGSSLETHTAGSTYAYTVQEGRLITSTFNYLNNAIIDTPVLVGTSSITLKSTNTSGIFPYRLSNSTVKVTDNQVNQGTSYKTLSNQTITISNANVVDTITFIPLSPITVNLVNRVADRADRDIILAVNVNGQLKNPAIDENEFNIPTTGTATLRLTYVTTGYNLGTTPTTTTTIGLDTIATFSISGSTYSIKMFALYTATLDLALMTVNNSKLTFTYNNVPYTIIANSTTGNNFTINDVVLNDSSYVLTTTLPFASPLPVFLPNTFSYFPDKSLTTTAFSSLSWKGEPGEDNVVDMDETLTFSLGYFITVGNNSTISLYKHTEFKTIFDKNELRNLTITTAPSQLSPRFIKDDIYYLLSNLDIPNFYGIISNSSITLTKETKYAITTATSTGLTTVNFKLESTGALNYYEIRKDVGAFKTPLYLTNGYTVGATYISTAPSTVNPPTGNIFYNIVITGGVTVTVTIPNGTLNYISNMLGSPVGTLPNGTYTIPGNKLGGQYLINDLTFTYNGNYSNVSGSAVRLYSNVQCSGSVDLFVNVATPIGGSYASSIITYVSGTYTGNFTIDGSKLDGGGDLTGASILGTVTKVISGTYAGTKPQYFTNVPADAVEGVNTFDIKWIANDNIIITLNTNTDTFSGGTTGRLYTLRNFEGTLDLFFTLKGISTIPTGTISAGNTLTYTPTYNISGTNAYTAENAILSVDTIPVITKTVNAGSSSYTINNLNLLQGATRTLTIVNTPTTSKHLFAGDYSLSRTFTTPTADQTGINLIAREESITFTFTKNGSIQTITLSNVKRTGATNSSTGSSNQNTFSLDLLGATATTYDYTATLSGNELSKSFNATNSLTITLVQIKIQIPSPLTGEFTSNNFTGWVSGAAFSLTSANDGLNTIPNYGFLSDSYTLTGTYTNTAVSMSYSVSIGTASPSPYTFNLNLYTLTVNFPDEPPNDLVDQVILELEVNNDGTYTKYSEFTFDNITQAFTHTFENIPPGCQYKLKRVVGTSDSIQTFTADGFSLAPRSYWGNQSHTMPNANKIIDFTVVQ